MVSLPFSSVKQDIIVHCTDEAEVATEILIKKSFESLQLWLLVMLE